MSDIKAIAGLILIHLHLQKLNSRFHLRVHSLPSNHIIKLFLEMRHTNNKEAHWLLLEWLILRQQSNTKGLIIDMDNRFNEIVSSFVLFSSKFSSGDRLIDIFPSCFSFYSSNEKSKESLKTHLHNLDNITLQASADSQSAIIVLDACHMPIPLIWKIHLYSTFLVNN